MPTKIKIITGFCGCQIPSAKKYVNKEKFVCSKCGNASCSNHTFTYVDGNNISITKNAKPVCINCLPSPPAV